MADIQNIIEELQKESYEQTWGVRTLQRNINTQYYYRLLKSQNKVWKLKYRKQCII